MTKKLNEYEQPVGDSLPNWAARQMPGNVRLQGSFCRLEPLNADRHAADLYSAYNASPDGRDWTYMFAGPFQSVEEYYRYAESSARSSDPKHYAVIDTSTGKAVGTLALMRIDPTNGVIEVGNVAFSPLMKQKPASTEAQFLIMRYVFDELNYRRYEWKCDSLNEPSRKAADRLGFSFEGIFRQAVIYKERSRDTAWYSILDKEWPALKEASIAWLSAANFDSNGAQIKTLTDIRKAKTNQ